MPSEGVKEIWEEVVCVTGSAQLSAYFKPETNAMIDGLVHGASFLIDKPALAVAGDLLRPDGHTVSIWKFGQGNMSYSLTGDFVKQNTLQCSKHFKYQPP